MNFCIWRHGCWRTLVGKTDNQSSIYCPYRPKMFPLYNFLSLYSTIKKTLYLTLQTCKSPERERRKKEDWENLQLSSFSRINCFSRKRKKQTAKNWFHQDTRDVIKYITVSALPLSAEGDNFQSQILQRRGSGKNECLRGLKEFLPWIFVWGAYYCFLSKKDF